MHVIAIDDGYFPLEYKSRKGYTVLLGVLYDVDEHVVEGIAWNYVLVDGLDATEKSIEIINRLGTTGEEVVLLDGVTYAGFNIVDPRTIYGNTGYPCITVFRYPLCIERIEKALEKNFSDYMIRLEVIKSVLSRRYFMETKWRVIEYTPTGIEPGKARSILEKTQLYSPEPEPLRIADQLASHISRNLILNGTL